ncbi:hypothetical protein F5Y11DRAFT_312936 [Daldinia sp. FL1419]|nr:hypothetical protein F5Y11DRAFT_312936 [Daldinia sp. FL1419]
MSRSVKNAFRSHTMSQDKLIRSAHGLDVALDCISHFESLQDKGGYDIGKEFPYELYKKGVQQMLLNIWMANAPSIQALDGLNRNYSAGYAGREFARSLRVRCPENAIVLRVYVKNRNASPKAVLLHILGSLIWSLIALVPREFTSSDGLHHRKFETLMSRGHGSIEAGLEILESLPPLELGGRKLLCIVDGLDLAEERNTLERLQRLLAILGDVIWKNRAHLIYTLSRKSQVIRY